MKAKSPILFRVSGSSARWWWWGEKVVKIVEGRESMGRCWWGPFSCRSLEEFGRFIVEQCAIFRGKMSTDKIFLGCREHEINLQDLGRTLSGPPGGGRRGRGRGVSARRVVSWRAPPICSRVGKILLYFAMVLLLCIHQSHCIITTGKSCRLKCWLHYQVTKFPSELYKVL